MSPENLMAKKVMTIDLFKADLWSLGVTMFAFAYFQVPFKGESMDELL